jgi:hypothetical protein
LIRDNGKSQINEYSYISVMFYVVNDENPIWLVNSWFSELLH